MKIEIRQADLGRDRQLLIDTLLCYLTEGSDDARYDWLYLNNPYGQARTWIATDADSGATVGVASNFPRRIHIDGQKETVWVLGDFYINSEYRSLGPALALQRASLAIGGDTARTFCYDFPNTGMAAVYERIGVTPLGSMVRMARPLRVNRLLEEKLGSKPLAAGLAVFGNAWLRLTGPRPASPRDLQVEIHEGDCGEEFTALAEQVGCSYGICVDRSAEYLNWRFLRAPLNRFEIACVRRGPSLLGYAVYEQRGSKAKVADLFAVDDADVVSCLVGRVVEMLRNRGVVTVSMPVLETHRWIPLLERLGFRARETKPVFASAPKDSKLPPGGHDWFLTDGDRDS